MSTFPKYDFSEPTPSKYFLVKFFSSRFFLTLLAFLSSGLQTKPFSHPSLPTLCRNYFLFLEIFTLILIHYKLGASEGRSGHYPVPYPSHQPCQLAFQDIFGCESTNSRSQAVQALPCLGCLLNRFIEVFLIMSRAYYLLK